MSHNLDIGKRGEQHAAEYLLENGYKIIEKNYNGRWGEIDIISTKNNKLSFIEVKTRLSENFGKPYEAVTFVKINNLRRPVQYFLLKNNYKNYKLSLDVISVELKEDLSVKKLKHFENVGTYK